MPEKQTWGGSRTGSGRKKKEETKSKSFRLNAKAVAACEKHYGRGLNALINSFIIKTAATLPESKQG